MQLKIGARRHRILHVGGTVGNAHVLRTTLTGAKGPTYEVEWVATLGEGLDRLATTRMSAILLDLQLPDCPAADAVAALRLAAADTPLLALGTYEDEEITRRMTRAGAFDYLVIDRLDSYWLPRALGHAIDRPPSSVPSTGTSAAPFPAPRMSDLATSLALTDLPDHALLRRQLSDALMRAHRHQRRVAVLSLDIDRFKHINDSLGRMFGDELLRIVGAEITRCIRSAGTMRRQGGDQFLVVLPDLDRTDDAAGVAQQIITVLARPLKLADHELHITASIGISVYPDDGVDVDTLLRCADLALNQAKEQGRDCHQFFVPELRLRAVERQSIESGLHGAIGKREFELLYQPKMNLRTGSVVGAEALIRWRHPQRGLVGPTDFVRIAENCGLIKPIGRWVIHEACRQARAWQNAGLRRIPVSVNISADEFRGQGFVTTVADILTETRLDPGDLEIELRESVVAHVESTPSVLRAIKALGVKVAIDGFGTYWSGLNDLRGSPIDTLKVDRSIVHEINAGSSGALVVRAIIGMGKHLGHHVIAEGVETLDQVAFLQAEDCDEGQGYYFSRPLVPEQLARLLEGGTIRRTGASPASEWATSRPAPE